MEYLRPRVLVIDPDPAIRALLAAVVRRDGFDSDSAATAEEARWHTRDAQYDAVILEPRMRGGEALLHELPAGKVIVASSSAAYGACEVAAVLRKPFLIDELALALEACCATHA